MVLQKRMEEKATDCVVVIDDEVILQPPLRRSGTECSRTGHDRRDADFCQFSSDHCRSRGGKKLGGEVIGNGVMISLKR